MPDTVVAGTIGTHTTGIGVLQAGAESSCPIVANHDHLASATER